MVNFNELLKIDYNKCRFTVGVLVPIFEAESMKHTGSSDYKKIKMEPDFWEFYEKTLISLKNWNKESIGLDTVQRKELILRYPDLRPITKELVNPSGKYSSWDDSIFEETWAKIIHNYPDLNTLYKVDAVNVLRYTYDMFRHTGVQGSHPDLAYLIKFATHYIDKGDKHIQFVYRLENLQRIIKTAC